MKQLIICREITVFLQSTCQKWAEKLNFKIDWKNYQIVLFEVLVHVWASLSIKKSEIIFIFVSKIVGNYPITIDMSQHVIESWKKVLIRGHLWPYTGGPPLIWTSKPKTDCGAIDSPLFFAFLLFNESKIFLIKLDIKPLVHLLEISTFSLNNVIIGLTKFMKNLVKDLKILSFKVIVSV